jgi:hypothetical protein
MTKKEAQQKAEKLIKKNPSCIFFRSCWKCNPSHKHFLQGKWGGGVLKCFICGHWYYNKIDITEK